MPSKKGKKQCPVCHKLFATKEALREHMLAKHPLDAKTRVPKAPPVPKRSKRLATKRKTQQMDDGFLWCTFAPFDRAEIATSGVPDAYQGKTVSFSMHHEHAETLAANSTTWYVLAPVPGVSYFKNTSKLGPTKALKGKPYDGYEQWFPVNYETTNFTHVRQYSNVFEIVHMGKLLEAAGTIEVWDAPIAIEDKIVKEKSGSGSSVQYSGYTREPVVTGCKSFQSHQANKYVTHVKNGVYTVASAADEGFPFQDIAIGNLGAKDETATAPLSDDIGGSWSVVKHDTDDFYAPVRNMCAMGTKIIKVTVSVDTPIVVRTRACCEFKVNPESVFYPMATNSPQEPLVMAEYYRMRAALPVAVTADKNPGFFDFLKRAAKTVAGVVKGLGIPGVSDIAKGVDHFLPGKSFL